jgi:hypothetical protein
VLDIETEKGVKETITPVTTYSSKGGMPDMKIAYLKGGRVGFQLLKMNVGMGKGEKSSVYVNLVGLGGMMTHGSKPKPEILVAEVSLKPFMNLVWIASLLIVGGLLLAMIRRWKQA